MIGWDTLRVKRTGRAGMIEGSREETEARTGFLEGLFAARSFRIYLSIPTFPQGFFDDTTLETGGLTADSLEGEAGVDTAEADTGEAGGGEEVGAEVGVAVDGGAVFFSAEFGAEVG